MVTIEYIDDLSKEKVINFLKSVPSIENIDENILDNAVIALDDDKIIGCISYEAFSEKALIRYFVFKKVLNNNFLKELIEKLENKILKKDMHMLVCVADNIQIQELFQSLGFENIKKDFIFINEEHIKKTSFRNSTFMNKILKY